MFVSGADSVHAVIRINAAAAVNVVNFVMKFRSSSGSEGKIDEFTSHLKVSFS